MYNYFGTVGQMNNKNFICSYHLKVTLKPSRLRAQNSTENIQLQRPLELAWTAQVFTVMKVSQKKNIVKVLYPVKTQITEQPRVGEASEDHLVQPFMETGA